MNPGTTQWIYAAGNEHFSSAESSKAAEDIKCGRHCQRENTKPANISLSKNLASSYAVLSAKITLDIFRHGNVCLQFFLSTPV